MKNNVVSFAGRGSFVASKWGKVSVGKSTPHQVKLLAVTLANKGFLDSDCKVALSEYAVCTTSSYEQGFSRGVAEQSRDGEECHEIDLHILKLTHRNIMENSAEHALVKGDFLKHLTAVGLYDEVVNTIIDAFYVGCLAAFKRGFVMGVTQQMSEDAQSQFSING
tara:strand:+ start:16824 stop:17318 length:495 start_codon:yes stop_codon:yes gene_type:complete